MPCALPRMPMKDGTQGIENSWIELHTEGVLRCRYVAEEDLEQRLETILSQRAVALARAQQGRVDCVGASKGLFFGLLLLVCSIICLILFFVLVRHPKLGILAIYLADVSHSALMALSIFAIIIGFIR